jgi:aspartyl/asparaginyl-tRNA synthetase
MKQSIKSDFERKEEELIGRHVKETYNSDFVFITKFPYEARPFYHMLDSDGLTNSFDLIFKGIELTTGAQREHRHDILIKQIKGKGIDPNALQFYTDFFKYGCPPHGGFGMGAARFMMQLLEIDNIREATFVYRGPTRLNP